MVPLLTLGIPGSSTAAVLLSALMIHNLNRDQNSLQKNQVLYMDSSLQCLLQTSFLLLSVLSAPRSGSRSDILRRLFFIH